MRKKSFGIIVVVLVGISLTFPAMSQARGGWGRGGWGWYAGGAFVGGAILGAAIARPWYYGYPPPYYGYPSPYYAYPPPAVVYAPQPPVYSPNQAYAYPDPAVTSRQGPAVTPGSDGTSPSGQWIEVPGQSINGRWVPPHKAWAPNSP
jgi:hypothetical protein